MEPKLHIILYVPKMEGEKTNKEKTIQFGKMQPKSKRNILRVILENCDDSNFDLTFWYHTIPLMFLFLDFILSHLICFSFYSCTHRKKKRRENKTFRIISIFRWQFENCKFCVRFFFSLAFREFSQQCVHFLVFTCISIVLLLCKVISCSKRYHMCVLISVLLI